MEAELQWLLEQSIPETILAVGKQLSGISFLKSSKSALSDLSSQTSLTSNEGMEIRGTAAVSGISVTQLSLTLPHSQSGQTTTTHLRKGESLVLQQAQESLNFIKSVLRRLQSNVCFDSRETALVFMERILGDIQQAKAILAADDQQNLMPLQTGTTEKFAPALPENMVVECCLRGNNLVARVYWLKFQRDVKSAGILDAFTKEQSAGHTLIYNGRLAEVKKEIVYEAALEDLQRNIVCLHRAAGICIDIVGQIHAFDCI